MAYSGNSIADNNDSSLSDTYVAQATDPLGLGSIGGVAGFSYMYVGAFPASANSTWPTASAPTTPRQP